MSAERETEWVETGIQAPPGWLRRSWAGLGGHRLFLFRRCSALGLRGSRSGAFLLTDCPLRHSSPPPETDARPAGQRTHPAPSPLPGPTSLAPPCVLLTSKAFWLLYVTVDSLTVLSWQWFREKGAEGALWLELGGRRDRVSSVTLCHVPSACLFSSFWSEGTPWGQVQGTSHSRFLVSLWVGFWLSPQRARGTRQHLS